MYVHTIHLPHIILSRAICAGEGFSMVVTVTIFLADFSK